MRKDVQCIFDDFAQAAVFRVESEDTGRKGGGDHKPRER